MKQIVCDKCGKIINANKHKRVIVSDGIIEDEACGDYACVTGAPDIDKDLCDECIARLKGWLESDE